MRRRGLAALAVTAALFLAFCACESGEPIEPSGNEPTESVLSAESFSLPAESVSPVPPESSFDTSSEASADDGSSPTPDTSDASSDASSEPTDGAFRPWRGEDEPDLGGLKLPAIPEEGFSFPVRSMTLRTGETAQVAYEFKPLGASDRSLSWSSSDETVATVADGTVTAVGPGTATVRAETAAGHSAECRVTVVASDALSPLTRLAVQLTDGELAGRQFSRYDVNLDGSAELFVREIGADGVPVVTVYASDGKVLLSTRTGDDEEWAIWRRKEGGRYLLLSYTRTTDGIQRYALDEVTASGGGAVCSPLFARETASDGAVAYFHASDGALASCDGDTYDSLRKAYFAKNRQLPKTELQWVRGETERELDQALRALTLPGER